MILSGMLVGLATGSTDPIAGLVELAPNPAFGIVLLVFIMLADYFILRKTQLDVVKLYDNNTYRYASGFSPAGMSSLVAGAVVSFMFLDYSWLVGFPFQPADRSRYHGKWRLACLLRRSAAEALKERLSSYRW